MNYFTLHQAAPIVMTICCTYGFHFGAAPLRLTLGRHTWTADRKSALARLHQEEIAKFRHFRPPDSLIDFLKTL
jgi:hypothetical protein